MEKVRQIQIIEIQKVCQIQMIEILSEMDYLNLSFDDNPH